MRYHPWSCLVWVLGIASIVGADRPVLIPSTHPVYKAAGHSWNVTCVANQSIVWEWGGPEQSHHEVEITNETYSSGPYLYSLNLFIAEVSTLDVRPYTCHHEDDVNAEVSVDLFVMDPTHFFATNQLYSNLIRALEDSVVTLPCRVAHPNISVILKSPEGEEIDPETTPGISYDIHTGFTIESVKVRHTGTWFCEAKWGNSKPQNMGIDLMISKPIQDNPRIETDVGDGVQSGSTFVLKCNIRVPIHQQTLFSLLWTEPKEVIFNSSRAIATGTTRVRQESGVALFESSLTVKDARREDGGDYVCKLDLKGLVDPKFVNYSIQVYDIGEEFISISPAAEYVEVRKKATAKWTMNISAFPTVRKYKWFNKNKVQIDNRTKPRFVISEAPNRKAVNLSIQNVEPEDAGVYYFWATNDYMNDTVAFNLTVRSEPDVKLVPSRATSPSYGGEYYMWNSTLQFNCKANGYPYPVVTWEFQACHPKLGVIDENCIDVELPKDSKKSEQTYEEPRQGTFSTLSLPASNHGYVICTAKNELGSVPDELKVKIIDFPTSTGFEILGNASAVETTVLQLDCAVSKTEFATPQWKVKRVDKWEMLDPLVPNGRIHIEQIESPWSIISRLTVPDVRMNDKGNYSCSVTHSNGTTFEQFRLVDVPAHEPPIFESPTNLNDSEIHTGAGELLGDLMCHATGTPPPKLTWLWNDIPSDQWEYKFKKLLRYEHGSEFLVLRIPPKPEYSGKYVCRADNGVVVQKFMDIQYSEGGINLIWLIIPIVMVVFVAIIAASLGLRVYRQKQFDAMRWRKMYEDLIKGNPEAINPDLPVSDQINLLPYDPRWEFPREKLVLGQQLGGGAYGLVMKAYADGIKKDEDRTVCAVKMVKSTEDQSCLDALIGELKILGHMGQHVNVVNLLGACTAGFPKKDLYVIVEYCSLGNLRKYLLQHKKNFINQIDPHTEEVTPYSSAHQTTATQSNKTAPSGYRLLEEVANSPVPSAHNATYQSGASSCGQTSNVQSCVTDMSYLPNSMNTNDERRPSTGDSDEDLMDVDPMTTLDLIYWAFQIASGMEYLASRNVLHGDLAARNVLVADGKIVKICDFGLSRQMYENSYKKTNKEQLLPFHWMALESITEWSFSTKSDVWSYGVTLWEIFTLGQTPYPGFGADDKFEQHLKSGGRLEKPARANSAIYDLMFSCWRENPDDRPTFTEIAQTLRDMLDEAQRNKYSEMHEIYFQANKAWLEGREDYLKKMARGDFTISREATPDYVNIPTVRVIPNHDHSPSPDDIKYQNMEKKMELQALANNAGYVFMNKNSIIQSQPVDEEEEEEDLPARGTPSPFTDVPKLSGGNVQVLSTNQPQKRTTPIFIDDLIPNFSTSVSIDPPSDYDFKNFGLPSGTLETYKKTDEEQDSKNQVIRKKNDSGFSSSSSEHASDIEGTGVGIQAESPTGTENYADNQGYFNPSLLLSGKVELRKSPDVFAH